MENLWVFYSLGGLLALGFGDFLKKLILSKGANKEVFLLVCFCLYVPLFFINMLFQGTGNIDIFTLQSGVIIGINNFFTPLGVLISLKYLDTSFSLISIRLVSSFFILLVGLFVLGDKLSLYDFVGFFLGMFAIFLLSGFQIGEKILFHRKGMIGVFIAMIGIIFGNSYFKYVVSDINVHDFMLVQFSATLLCLLIYMSLRNKFEYLSKIEVAKVFPYAIGTVIIFALHFLYFLPNIYLLGPLSIGYKMLSYSLIVPIMLSILFLGDPIDKRRTIAFILTIMSIFLFLI